MPRQSIVPEDGRRLARPRMVRAIRGSARDCPHDGSDQSPAAVGRRRNLWYARPEQGGGQVVALATYERGLALARQQKARVLDLLEPQWGEPELLTSALASKRALIGAAGLSHSSSEKCVPTDNAYARLQLAERRGYRSGDTDEPVA
jgi:hypothetical protein